MGEENIFLFDALKKGLKIINLPILLGTKKNKRKSTWYTGINEKYLKVKGACFYRMSQKAYLFLIIQYIIRKHKIYSKSNISIIKAFKLMLIGKNEYTNLTNNFRQI